MESGRLAVGDGHRIYWEVRGNPDGKPAVVLHGGPGSGAHAGWAELFDLSAHRVVLAAGAARRARRTRSRRWWGTRRRT